KGGSSAGNFAGRYLCASARADCSAVAAGISGRVSAGDCGGREGGDGVVAYGWRDSDVDLWPRHVLRQGDRSQGSKGRTGGEEVFCSADRRTVFEKDARGRDGEGAVNYSGGGGGRDPDSGGIRTRRKGGAS